MPDARGGRGGGLWARRSTFIAAAAVAGIVLHVALRYPGGRSGPSADWPLLAALALGGTPLVIDLLRKLAAREFGSDLLAGMSIVTSVVLGEYLAGTIVVLMLAGGEVLEEYAVANASSVLRALARRMPSTAHRRQGGTLADVPLADVAVGDVLVVFPHETCPVDGHVIEGHGVMDESYLTGEPFQMSKTVGSGVISGAINGESALVIEATERASDSRYAKIMEVMRESEEHRPRLRRLGDRLGAAYTPVALALAFAAWAASGDAVRFLAVLVIATPCPLLIAIPVAIIGSVSLCARRAIIVRNPVALERVTACRTAIFDKTGTLTYGQPKLTEQLVAPDMDAGEVLGLVAALEQYSKHPLARALLDAAGGRTREATEVHEAPGQGLEGVVAGRHVRIAGRRQILNETVRGVEVAPPAAGGLECLVAVDGRYAATYRFRDAPRRESRAFIEHLAPKHHFERVMVVSGDREAEVRYLADEVGIREVYAQQSPEEKLAIVRSETARAQTLYVGDGINDAPAMAAATVGMAIGQRSDVTTEAAAVVIMDNSLSKVDEFLHVSRRMHAVALQSAVGGMVLSIGGMLIAAAGHLSPVSGALAQEVIDVIAVVNALRAAVPPRVMRDH